MAQAIIAYLNIRTDAILVLNIVFLYSYFFFLGIKYFILYLVISLCDYNDQTFPKNDRFHLPLDSVCQYWNVIKLRFTKIVINGIVYC